MKFINQKLEQAKNYRLRKQNGIDKGFIDFSSNDYLGLAKEKATVTANSGSASSRLISGQHPLLSQLEKELSKAFSFESALFFGSGYHANLALISAFNHQKIHFVCDELIHASIHDGLKMGNASLSFFKHNDMPSLEEQLVSTSKETIIVVESTYSMDGDQCDWQSIKAMANKHNAKIIVDEAHSTGLIGEEYLGLAKNDKNVLAKVVTFGKAFGCEGGLVLCNKETKSFLVNFSRPLIYSTAPSPLLCKSVLMQFELWQKSTNAINKLNENCDYFKGIFKEYLNQNQVFKGPIFPILLPKEKLLTLEQKCLENKIAVKAIFHPTVAKGQERLRICLHAYNTQKEIDLLFKLLSKVLETPSK